MQILLHKHHKTPSVLKMVKLFNQNASHATLEPADASGDSFQCTIKIVRAGRVTKEETLPACTLTENLQILAKFIAAGLFLQGILLHKRFSDSLQKTITQDQRFPVITISRLDI